MSDSGASPWVRDVLVAGAAAVLVAVSARLSFPLPGTALPQTAQTIAVLLVGAVLGLRRGTLAIALYIVAGSAGLPVFAEGASGLSAVLGPSAGYLLGFVAAAALLGWYADRGMLARSWWHALAGMAAAHALILLLGGAFLALRIGPQRAWSAGVEQFLLGAAVKSTLGALLLVAIARVRRDR